MQCTLGLGCFLPGAVTNESAALGQAKVEGQQGAVLHTDGPQRGAINLQGKRKNCIGTILGSDSVCVFVFRFKRTNFGKKSITVKRLLSSVKNDQSF